MSFRERLRIDPEAGTTHAVDVRYMMIRPDALMGIFARLSPPAREAAMQAFKASIVERGGHSAANYVERHGTEALLGVIEATAADLGWGRWRFSQDEAGLTLRVENSTFAEGATFDGPVCHPIAGMCEVVGGLFLRGAVDVRETACARVSGGDCAFRMELKPT